MPAKKVQSEVVLFKTNRPATIPDAIDHFAKQLNSLAKAVIQTMKTLDSSYHEHVKKADAFIKSKGKHKKIVDGMMQFTLTDKDSRVFERMDEEVESLALARRNVPIALFVALVSQYDAYLSNLLSAIFYIKPELLNTSQKQFTFSELVSFDSFDAAKNHIIEKEIETVLRSSHSEQFDWMENKFGLPLRKDLDVWPCFVELTERRNLFVHCDGMVSSQYISVCGKFKDAITEKFTISDVLNVDAAYFAKAYAALYEIGVKLGHVLWRKLLPNDIGPADSHLNELAFDLLAAEKYTLAKVLLKFATETLKKYNSDVDRRVFLVNYCIALKHLNDNSYKNIIASEDWTACSQDFHLAVAVLKMEYLVAAGIMVEIGRDGRISEREYRTWPLFHEFRQSEEFKKSFKRIFKKEFMVEETAGDVGGPENRRKKLK